VIGVTASSRVWFASGAVPCQVLRKHSRKRLRAYATGISIPNRISKAFGYFLVSET